MKPTDRPTVQDEARYATRARYSYRRNADRLWQMATELYLDGWQGWARQVERFAMIAERAAQAER